MENNEMIIACSEPDDMNGDQTKRDSDVLRTEWKRRRCTIRFPKMKPNEDGVLEPTNMNMQQIFRLLWAFPKLPMWAKCKHGNRVRVEIELQSETFAFSIQKDQHGHIMVRDLAGVAPSYDKMTKALDKKVSELAKVCFCVLCQFIVGHISTSFQCNHFLQCFVQEYVGGKKEITYAALNLEMSRILDILPAGEIDWTHTDFNSLVNVSLEYMAVIGVSHHHVHKKNIVQKNSHMWGFARPGVSELWECCDTKMPN